MNLRDSNIELLRIVAMLAMIAHYYVLVMLGVFAVCSALDYLRIRFIDKPIFKLFE